MWYEWRGAQLLLKLKVQARGKGDAVIGPLGDRLRIRINAPPVDGRANAALIDFLATEFAVPRSRIRIAQGEMGRLKTLTIDQPVGLPTWFRAFGEPAKTQ